MKINAILEPDFAVICCKDCRYQGDVDDKDKAYHECKYFSNWSTAHFMLDTDFCSMAEPKEDL